MELHSQDTQLGGRGVTSVLPRAAAAPARAAGCVPCCVLESGFSGLPASQSPPCKSHPGSETTYSYAGVGQKRDASNKMASSKMQNYLWP